MEDNLANSPEKLELIQKKSGWIKIYIWLPLSFLAPYLVACLRRDVKDIFFNVETLRFGLLGVASAYIVYLLWWLDSRYGSRQMLSQIDDKVYMLVIYILAIGLWLCIFAILVVATMAYLQVFERPTLLPGL